MMHLTSVLLPAPFSPSRARKLPGCQRQRDVGQRLQRAEALATGRAASTWAAAPFDEPLDDGCR